MIKFYNIRSGETRSCETAEQIAAHYNSSNLHVNALVGQDFGWRIAPETVKRMEDVRRDQIVLDRIAQAFNLPQGEVKDVDVLAWISMQDQRSKTVEVQQSQDDFEKEYETAVRKIREGEKTDNSDAVKENGSGKLEVSKTNKEQ